MSKNKQPSRRKFIGNIILIILLLISAIFYVASRYKYTHFNNAQIDEIIYYFTHGLGDGQSASILATVQDNLFFCAIVFFLLLLPVIDFYRDRVTIHLNLAFLGKKKRVEFNPSRISLRSKMIYAVTMFLVSFWILLSSFGVIGYVKSLVDTGQVFEKEYVDPQTVRLVFPEKKRNLVYIYLESMENTIVSTSAGGQSEESIIPELEAIASDPKNVSFSHQKEGLGGPLATNGATWTVGAMTAQAGGIPLKTDVLGEDHNSYGKYSHFLPGTYMLGDILRAQGYNQTFIMGSKATFGGRDKLLTQHGNYAIHDYEYAKKEGLIPSDYSVWWGYEDKKLFEFAKNELNRLSSEDKPFNLQLLTVDTHFTDGYLDPTCPTPYQDQYDNVYACSSKQVSEFVSWIQQQPYAEDTVIILAGDHPGMQTSYYDKKIHSENYVRTTYNAFINSAVSPEHSANGRLFSPFDMYPTTLAAMGVNIPGDQLALGVNLFSERPTLVEQYGSIQSFNSELRKRSDFYNNHLIAK